MNIVRKGFSFIELLVALTIFSVIALSIYYALMTGVKLYRRSSSDIRHNQGVRAFFDRIDLDIKNSFFSPVIEPQWDADSISFALLVDNQKAGKKHREIARVSYGYDSTDQQVIRSYSRKDKGFYPDPALEQTIVQDTEGLSFEYCYQEQGSQDACIWKPHWQQKEEMPKGIKVTLKLAAGERFREYVFNHTGTYGTEQ